MASVIQNRDKQVIYKSEEAATVEGAVIEAVSKKISLRHADLRGCDLHGANLKGAELQHADISVANLSGATLRRASLRFADLSGCDLRGADLRCADLTDADVGGAVLTDADLTCASLGLARLRWTNFSNANLTDTDLRRTDCSGADFSGARLDGTNFRNAHFSKKNTIGIEQHTHFLQMLLEQPGKIRAYKLIRADGLGPWRPEESPVYEIGKSYEVLDADTNAVTTCGAGINVSTLDWIQREYRYLKREEVLGLREKQDYRVLIVEFEAKDIAAIPIASNGKFRLFRCDVVGEKTISESPTESGLTVLTIVRDGL